MDAHIATIIADYLPLHSSNVFLALLGLTEHIIPRPADSATSLHPTRGLEIIRCLKYPSNLILTTRNIQAALESGREDYTSMFAEDFNAFGEYVSRYPNMVELVTRWHSAKFKKYLGDMLPATDMRYIDFVYDTTEEIRDAYFTATADWSLNRFKQSTSLVNSVDILKRLRNNTTRYSVIRFSHGTYVVYQTPRGYYRQRPHYDLFNYIISTTTYNDDDLLALIQATYSSMSDVLESISFGHLSVAHRRRVLEIYRFF